MQRAWRYIDYISSEEDMRPILSELSRNIGSAIEFLPPPPDLSGPREEDAPIIFDFHHADFGRMCSPAYCLASAFVIPLAAPTKNNQELPVYFSQLFVRSDRNYFSFEDLKGATLAFNDEMSLSGYHCLKFYLMAYNDQLVASGCRSCLPFFDGIIRTGAHVKSVQAVVSGFADVVCLDCNVLEALQESQEGAALVAQLRPIPVPDLSSREYVDPTTQLKFKYTASESGKLGPNPTQPIVVSRRLSDDTIALLRQHLLSLPSSIVASIRAECYIPVDEIYYAPIHAMLHYCTGAVVLCSKLGE